jgi:hypothetical protein
VKSSLGSTVKEPCLDNEHSRTRGRRAPADAVLRSRGHRASSGLARRRLPARIFRRT